MTSKLQQRISKIRLGAASAALTLLVVLGFGVVTTPLAQARTYKVLHKFTDGSDGGGPFGGVIRDAQGNLYGTTYNGGNSACWEGCGVVFKLDPTGQETVLYTFTGGANGAKPEAGVIRDAQGNLYGTTDYGGDMSSCDGVGCGVVFKVDTSGNETVLYSFTGGADGAEPFSGLIRDAQGNLYGTAQGGGAYGEGVVFKVDTTGQETVLYSFCSEQYCDDGLGPLAGVIRDAQGNLYGTAQAGGAYDGGVVFELSATGQETVLHSFCSSDNCSDGLNPAAGVIRDAQGNLYGTAEYGGNSKCGIGCGVVFKLSPTGKETVLHRFTGGADGSDLWAGVIRDAQGNLYGNAQAGGTYDGGVVFELSPSGKETVLHSFNGSDEALPYAVMIRDAQGNLCGTTYRGGNSGCQGGCGVVFELKP